MNEEFAIKLKTILDQSSIALVKQQLAALKEEVSGNLAEATSAAASAKTGIGINPDDLAAANQYSARIAYIIAQINDLSEQVRLIDLGEAEGDVLKLEAEIERLREQLDKLIHKGQSSVSLVNKMTVSITNNFKQALKSATRIVGAMIGVRTVFSSIRKAMRSYLAQNDELQAKLNGAWYALGSLFAPVLEWIINKFVYLVSLVDAFVKSLGFAGVNMSKYGKATGKAAKEQKQLAGFDELNNLSSQDSGGGGGSAGMQLDPVSDEALKKFKTIATIVAGIAAGLAAWKIATDLFKLPMGEAIGLGVAVAGATVFVLAFVDAWKNGIDWNNLSLMLGGVTLAMIALSLAFSPVLGGAVAVIGGIALLVLGIREFIQTGEMTKPVFAAIAAGCALIGAGIALITGTWIPLIIGLIAGILLPAILESKDQIIAWWNETKQKLADGWDNIKQKFHDGIDSVKKFIGDMKTGIVNKFNEIKTGATNLFNNLKSGVSNFFSNIGSTISNKFRSIINSYIINPINRVISWLNDKLNFNFGGLSLLGQQVIAPFNVQLAHLSTLPSLDVGTNYVPNDMLAQIHQGEAVVPKEFNEDQFNNSAETNELLRELIEVVGSKQFRAYISKKEITDAAVQGINERNRIFGGSVI